jgi:hypothetical protein
MLQISLSPSLNELHQVFKLAEALQLVGLILRQFAIGVLL